MKRKPVSVKASKHSMSDAYRLARWLKHAGKRFGVAGGGMAHVGDLLTEAGWCLEHEADRTRKVKRAA